MGKDEPKREAFVAQKNFTISTAEQLAALAAGPPAFARRLRKIEDLRAAIVRALVEQIEAASRPASDIDDEPVDPATLVARDLERLNRLIDDHNRYYPIEARLRIDLRTRQLMDWGEPWQPMPKETLEALLTEARATCHDGEPRRGSPNPSGREG